MKIYYVNVIYTYMKGLIVLVILVKVILCLSLTQLKMFVNVCKKCIVVTRVQFKK